MKTLIIVLLVLLAAGITRAQSASGMENRFKNEVPGKEDSLAFRFKGRQLLASVIEYAKICADTGTYPIAVCNQAYQSVKKRFSDHAEFYFIENGKPMKTDYGVFLKKLTNSKLCPNPVIHELPVTKKSGAIGRVEATCDGFTVQAERSRTA